MIDIRNGDALAELHKMPSASVDCCVTSPPYWGLRDYGCDGQIGLEPTPSEWLAVMVKVFAEVRRVMTPWATLWLNIGDKYVSDGGSGHQGNSNSCRAHRRHTQLNLATAAPSAFGLKAKDLCLLPERLAIALQDDGWYVRQRCIWHKPSAMPESTKDRPTTDFEHIWMLTKSETYFYDSFAVMETASGGAHSRGEGTHRRTKKMSTQFCRDNRHSGGITGLVSTRNLRSVWRIPAAPYADEMCGACYTYYDARDKRQLARTDDQKLTCRCGRSDAWIAHFATFPPALPALCIRASTSEQGCCVWCGAPVERIVRRPRIGDWNATPGSHAKPGAVNMNAIKSAATGRMGRGAGWREALKKTYGGKNLGMAEQDKSRQMQGRLATARAVGGAHDTPFPAPEHVGWRTCCAMNFDNRTRPGVVLDPFAGAGTTLMAAERLGRRAIGIELNGDYICMARERIGRAIKRNTEQANRVYSEQ